MSANLKQATGSRANHRYVAGNAIVNLETAGKANEAYHALGESVLDKKKLIGERAPVIAQQVVTLAERLVREQYVIDTTKFDDTILNAVDGALADVMRGQMEELKLELERALKEKALKAGTCKALERKLANAGTRLTTANQARMKDRKEFGEQLALLKTNAEKTRDILGQSVSAENVERAAQSVEHATSQLERVVSSAADDNNVIFNALNEVKAIVVQRTEETSTLQQQVDSQNAARQTDRAHQQDLSRLNLAISAKNSEIESLNILLKFEQQTKQVALDVSSDRYQMYDEWRIAQTAQLETRDKQFMLERKRADEQQLQISKLEHDLNTFRIQNITTTVASDIESNNLKAAEKQIQHLNESLTASRAELARERRTADELRKEAAIERQRAGDLIATELSRLKKNHDKLETGTMTREEHQEAMTNARQDMMAYTKSLHDAQDDVAANHTKTVALIERMFELVGDKQKLEGAATLHASQLDMKEAEYKAAMAKRDQEWTERLTELRKLHENERTRLSDDIATAQKDLREEQARHRKTDADFVKFLSESAGRTDAHIRALTDLEEQLTAVHMEKEGKARERSDLALADLQSRLDDATTINSTRAERIAVLEQAVEDHDKTIDTLMADKNILAQVIEENSNLTSSEAEAKDKSSAIASTLETARLTKTQLQAEVATSETRFEEQGEALVQYKAELDKLFTDNAGMMDGQQHDASAIQMLTQEVNTLNTSIRHVTGQRNALSKQKKDAVKELGDRIVTANNKIKEVKAQGKKWYDNWQDSLKQRIAEKEAHAGVIEAWKNWDENRKAEIYTKSQDKQIDRQSETIHEQVKALALEQAAKEKLQTALNDTIDSFRQMKNDDAERQQELSDLRWHYDSQEIELQRLQEVEQGAQFDIYAAQAIANDNKKTTQEKTVMVSEMQHTIKGMTEELQDLHKEIGKLYRELSTAANQVKTFYGELVNPVLRDA
nr:hypothetical protein B0A51_07867 [Rachicladosporium sp. CCFEE 5018]